MKRFVLLCLVFCTLSLAQVENVETAFEPSSSEQFFLMEDWVRDMKRQYEYNSFHWRGEGFYIIRELYKDKHFYGTAVAFLPVNSVFLTSRFIMDKLEFYSDDVYECDDCLFNTIHRHREKIKKMCTANFTITKEFYNLIKRFIDEDRPAIVDTSKIKKMFYTPDGSPCYYDFYIFYQDKNGNQKYFHMIPSKCIDNEMRKNPIVDEYIELYDTFDSLFTTKYYDCRWDRVSSKEEIIQQCGKCKLEFINYEE
ncbi:MAG: hypothetical protein MJY82_06775 [Fibrobacter sp.]|nr:hypothetical protein [Fibrobacter sp.]